MQRPLSLCVCVALVLGAGGWARCQQNELKSFGSGFIVDARGYVLTNEHVVHRAKSVKVLINRKDSFIATVLSVDADHDLALLKIEADRPLAAIPIGNSSEVKRQQNVMAIGFPFGEGAITSTSGRIVSIREEGANQLLVTDAVVNPGNSGGPLLNDRGEVIGVIRSLLLAEVGGARVKAGEIYAIPISFALPMLAAIPGYDWSAVGKAQQTMELSVLDSKASPAVVQVLSDRVEPGTIAGASGQERDAFKEDALALIKSYIDRMELKYDVDTGTAKPVITVAVKMDNATHHLRIVIDAENELVYLFLNRFVTVAEKSPQLAKVLRALMDYNWQLNVGKFEWDKSDGEVRYSYTFTTENGVGFEAFEAIFVTLLKTGDRLWPELSKLAEAAPARQKGP